MSAADLEAVKSVAEAEVYKAGAPAGLLVRHRSHVEFRYHERYLRSGGRPVATTLPLSDEPVRAHAGAVPPFFAGLLPEGRRLTTLRRAVKTSADDELSLLLAVGGDMIGDVQVGPRGAVLDVPAPLVEIDGDWSKLRFADLLADAGVVDRVGLPGVQDKVSAAMIPLPLQSAGSEYVLKLDPPEFKDLVANEAYFLERAADLGIPVAEAVVVTDADGRQGLLVTRFDRRATEEGGTRSLACEDACQVLGRWPADKYNVTAEEVVTALASMCSARPVAARLLFQQLVYAWLTGDGDVHAKNLSILAELDGEWRVAPAYDLPCTVVYGDTTMALPVNGRKTGLSRRHWLVFAEAIGLPERAAVRVLDDLLDGLEDLVDELRAGALALPERKRADLVRALRNRRRLIEGGR